MDRSGNDLVPGTGEVVERAGFGLAQHLPVAPQLKLLYVCVRELFQSSLAKVGHEVALDTADILVVRSLANTRVNLLSQFCHHKLGKLCKRLCSVC
jgi:hypothetical protein